MVVRSPVRFLVWFCLWLLMPYLVFLGGGWAGIYDTDFRMTSVVLIGAVLIAWTVAAVRDPRWRPGSRLAPAFAAALTAFAIGAFLSDYRRIGLEYLAYAILLTALYFLLGRLLSDSDMRHRVMAIVVAMGLINGGLYVLQVSLAWIDWWDLVGRITTPPLRPRFAGLALGNPSAVMTVQVLLSAASVAWMGWQTPARRVVSSVLVAVAMFATVVSGSRSGWLALAAAIVVASALWLATREGRAAVARTVSSRRSRLLALLGGSAFTLVVLAVAPAVLVRAGLGGEGHRLSNYAQAWRMFMDAPVAGSGPGSWVIQRVRYLEPPEPDHYIPYAHNLPLQTLAEFGMVGAAAGVVVVVATALLIRDGMRSTERKRQSMGWVALFGSAYFVGHQMLDFYGNMPTALFAYAVPIAYLDATRTSATADRPGREKPVALAGAVLCALAVSGLVRSESIAATAQRAVDLAHDGRWDDALPLARDAVAADGDIPAYQFTLGSITWATGDHATAREAFLRAASIDDFPASWIGVAASRTSLGDETGAREAIGRALRVGEQQPSVMVGAADLHLQLGDVEEATELLTRAVLANPSLAGDAAWATEPRLAPVREEVLAAARRASSGVTRVELELSTGNSEAALAAADASPEPSSSLLAAVVRGWGGDAAALVELQRRAADAPFDLETLVWTARVADEQGNERLADRYRAWADLVNDTTSVRAHSVRFSDRPEPGAISSPLAFLYGHYTYRRPTTVNHIPLDLLHLELE